MAANAGIEIKGLAEFRKTLKELNPELDKKLEDELTGIAEGVAVDARKRVPSLSGRARASVIAGATPDPYLAAGGTRAPYYGWLDFGSRTPHRGQSRRVGPWTRAGKGPMDGRYIYPAIDENRDEIIKAATAAFASAWYATARG